MKATETRVKLRVDEIIKEKGISVYSLWNNYFKSLGYTHLNNIIKGRTKKISYETIAKFCEALNCSPGALFKKYTVNPFKENQDDNK